MAKPTQPETRGHGGAGARSQQQQSHQEPVHQEGVLRAEEVGRGRQRLSSHLGHQRQAVQLWMRKLRLRRQRCLRGSKKDQ
ncbi:uncharacterized protein LOC144329412 isoform X4 [Macaca mulatta]